MNTPKKLCPVCNNPAEITPKKENGKTFDVYYINCSLDQCGHYEISGCTFDSIKIQSRNLENLKNELQNRSEKSKRVLVTIDGIVINL